METPSQDAVKKKLEEVAGECGIVSDCVLEKLEDKFEKAKRQDDYRDFVIKTRDNSLDERIQYVKKKEEEFWEENELSVVKSPYSLDYKSNYEEAPRGEVEGDGPTDLKLIVKACEYRLDAYAEVFFKHFLKLPNSLFHRFLYKTLQREINGGKTCKWAIAAPRRSSKSSLVSNILPLWCTVYNKRKFILLVSDTAGQAEDFLSDVKVELETNMLLATAFPHAVGKGKVWRTDEIITNNNVKIKALGTGTKIRGRKFGADRPDLIIGDDLENEEMVRSEIQRRFVQDEWFNKGLMFAGSDDVQFFIVGTVIGKDSLMAALLNPSQYPDWSSRRFKAVEKFSMSPLWDKWKQLYMDRFDLDRKETSLKFFEDNKAEMLDGTAVLWPEGRPYYELMQIKAGNESAFLAEQQNESIDLTKIYVTKEQLHWESFDYGEHKKAVERAFKFGAIDPSLGKKSHKGDYSAIVTVARDPITGYIYVLDMDLKRRSVDDQINDIIKLYERYPWRMFGVETVAFQYVVASALRKKSRELGAYIPLKEINQTTDKKVRFEGIVPLLTDGTIIFDRIKYRQNSSYNLAIEQIVTFTGEQDAHDDACLLAGSNIITDIGVLPIEEIKEGMNVLTHTGTFKKVTKTFCRTYSGEIFKLKASGLEPLYITNNHSVLVNQFEVIKDYKNRLFYTKAIDNFYFKPVEFINKELDLVNSPVLKTKQNVILDMSKYINYPIIKEEQVYGSTYKGTRLNNRSNPVNRFIEVDEKFAFILGYYLAEGGCNKSHCFGFSGHEKENRVVDFLREEFGKFGIDKSYYYIKNNTKSRSVLFNSVPFCKLFETFGSRHQKHLPYFCMNLGDKETKSLILGYFFGDGNFTTGTGRSISISASISYQIYFLLLKIGFRPSLAFVRRKGRWEGITGKIKSDFYSIGLSVLETNELLSNLPSFIEEIYKDKNLNLKPHNSINSSSYKSTKFLSKKIRELTSYWYDGEVYNLEVEEDNSYVANGVTVHNCDALQMAIEIAKAPRFKLLTSQNRK